MREKLLYGGNFYFFEAVLVSDFAREKFPLRFTEHFLGGIHFFPPYHFMYPPIFVGTISSDHFMEFATPSVGISAGDPRFWVEKREYPDRD